MSVVKIENKAELLHFFNEDRFLHLYEIGDLDDFFWPYSDWYGLESDGSLKSVFLLYKGSDLPVLLALENSNDEAATELILAADSELPDRLYCHLSPTIRAGIERSFKLESHGVHDKMSLTANSFFDFLDCSELAVRQLGRADQKSVLKLYEEAYPGNWFDQRMLLTGKYFGGFLQDKLVSISGVHVYSEEYSVAALGNITTLPAYRGKGYAKVVTAHLCQSLTQTIRSVGLNVKNDNQSAIHAYKQLGFEFHSNYEEFMAERI